MNKYKMIACCIVEINVSLFQNVTYASEIWKEKPSYLSFGDLDGGVEQGPGDNLIAGGGGEGALIAVEGVAVAGDEGREGVEAFHVLVHTFVGRKTLIKFHWLYG